MPPAPLEHVVQSHMTDVDCASLVPQPFDVVPIRSPTAVHSFLAARFASKAIVEIGTRNGDGMSCFSRTAASATAIERDAKYCKVLEARSRSRNGSTRRAFNVTCGDYRSTAIKGLLDGDFITWWEQPPLVNEDALTTLHEAVLARRIRHTAQAVLLFDSKWPRDRDSFFRVCRLATWSERVAFDEQLQCISMVRQGLVRSKHRDPEHRLCDRAKGEFVVVAVPLSDKRIASLLHRNDVNFSGRRPEVSLPAPCAALDGRLMGRLRY